MPIPWSVVPCAEEHGSREESFNGDNSFANVTLRVRADLSDQLIADLYGGRRAYAFNDTIPVPMYCKAARRIYPLGKYVGAFGNQVMNYTGDALVTAHYTGFGSCEIVRDPLTGDEISILEELEPLTEFLLRNPKPYYWFTGETENENGDVSYEWENIQKEEAPGTLLQRLSLKRTISGLSYVDPQILEFVGKVNNSPYFSTYLGQNFQPETLLFTPPIIRVSTCSKDEVGNKTRKWDLVVQFKFKDDGDAEPNPFDDDRIPDPDNPDNKLPPRAGWNHFYRAQKDKWERMYVPFISESGSFSTATAVDIYEPVDMSRILWDPDRAGAI